MKFFSKQQVAGQWVAGLVTGMLMVSGFAFATDEATPAQTEQGAQTETKVTAQEAEPVANKAYLRVTPIELLKEPGKYLDQDIQIEGTFNSFSSLGLDYKKAFRDSKDFISLMILRPDVTHHKIPLAELKLIYPRKKSDEVLELESGDVISIKGHVFSTALNDPWVDVEILDVIQKVSPKVEEKSEPECC